MTKYTSMNFQSRYYRRRAELCAEAANRCVLNGSWDMAAMWKRAALTLLRKAARREAIATAIMGT